MGRAEGRSPSAFFLVPLYQRGIQGDWSGGWVEVGYGWIPAFAGMTGSSRESVPGIPAPPG